MISGQILLYLLAVADVFFCATSQTDTYRHSNLCQSLWKIRNT